MKKIIYLSLGLALFLISCESTPIASFHTDTIAPEVGEKVFFTNDSEHAKSFEWDFGDGYISNDENPVHVFTGTGTFEVTLKAISKSGLADDTYLTLDVLIPTLLEIEVLEWYDKYSVSNASVYLFPTIDDWDLSQNDIAQGFTDEYGLVVFSHLDPFVYYVDVYEQNHDNYSLRNEDAGNIRTPQILPNHINRYIAWVDYVDAGKGTLRDSRKFVIKKFERKPDDLKQADADGGTENWQELYKRSVN